MKAKKSVAGRCIPETDVHEDDIEDYVVRCVNTLPMSILITAYNKVTFYRKFLIISVI